jgi:hypothetical protein
VARAQRSRNFAQVRLIGFTAPKRFLSEFQFALRADARKTEDMGAGSGAGHESPRKLGMAVSLRGALSFIKRQLFIDT